MTTDLKSSSSAFSNQLQVINGSFSFLLFFSISKFQRFKVDGKEKGFLVLLELSKMKGWFGQIPKKKKKVFSVAALRTKKRRTFQIDLLSRADFDIYRMILAIFRCIGISICNSQ